MNKKRKILLWVTVILAVLFKDIQLVLGVNWCLVDPKDFNEHSKKDRACIQYLKNPARYENRNPILANMDCNKEFDA